MRLEAILAWETSQTSILARDNNKEDGESSPYEWTSITEAIEEHECKK
jgi:hypothetical protein